MAYDKIAAIARNAGVRSKEDRRIDIPETEERYLYPRPFPMTAYQFLCGIPHVPMVIHGNLPIKASNSERRRWLENGSVIINGQKPKPQDEIHFPLKEVVFFPKSPRRTTMWWAQ